MYRTTLMALTITASSGLALAGHGEHWGYTGAEGPDHWGEIDPHFTVCQTGKNQAPIDLANFVDSQLPPIGFHYSPGGSDEVNNGHTIQIDYQAGSSITLDGRDYELKQFQFQWLSDNSALHRGSDLAGAEGTRHGLRRADRSVCARHGAPE